MAGFFKSNYDTKLAKWLNFITISAQMCTNLVPTCYVHRYAKNHHQNHHQSHFSVCMNLWYNLNMIIKYDTIKGRVCVIPIDDIGHAKLLPNQKSIYPRYRYPRCRERIY